VAPRLGSVVPETAAVWCNRGSFKLVINDVCKQARKARVYVISHRTLVHAFGGVASSS
jgi:hypothetical protein